MDKRLVRQREAAIGQMITARKFTVAKQGPDIRLIKMLSGRPVTVLLRKNDNGKFWLENPEREDICKNSFFDYCQTAHRVTRRKDLISQLVRQLQETSLWQFVENKNFFEVNTYNRKVNRRVVANNLQSILRGKRIG